MAHSTDELNELLIAAALEELKDDQVARFHLYLELIMKWNQRMNLTSIRDRAEIMRRHFVECIACGQWLPREIVTVLDLGSGAGLPGIPIAIRRPELIVTLAESQAKKASFLREVTRRLVLTTRVHGGRAEVMNSSFDCVALRAVDRMADAIRIARTRLRQGGWLAIMSTMRDQQKIVGGFDIAWRDPIELPGSEHRILLLGTAQAKGSTWNT